MNMTSGNDVAELDNEGFSDEEENPLANDAAPIAQQHNSFITKLPNGLIRHQVILPEH